MPSLNLLGRGVPAYPSYQRKRELQWQFQEKGGEPNLESTSSHLNLVRSSAAWFAEARPV